MLKTITAKSKKVFSLLTMLAVSWVFPAAVFAQEDDPIGTIMKPEAVQTFDTSGGIGEGDIGILFFVSRLFTYITILAGVWAFANLLLAGYTYITSSGNAQTHTKVRDKLTMSILGLILIVTVYTVGALLGTIFFGDATYFINPTIEGPGAV